MEKYIFDEMAELETSHWWFCARRDIISQVLNKYIRDRNNLRILDVGCGTGSYLKLLKKFGQVLGLEPNKSMAEYCQNQDSVIINCQIESYQSKQKFDLVTVFDVLEHIADDQKVIKTLTDLLNKDGYLLLTVPACKRLWSRHDLACHHHRRYEAQDITRLLQDDFRLIYISYYNFFLFPFIFAGLKLKHLFKSDQLPAKLPNKLINWLLYRIFSSERKIIASGKNMPFGVSIIALAQKK